MGKTFDCLTEERVAWLKQQKVFFVATAAGAGRINLSPKGHVEDTFAVLSPTRVAYLDFMGSGAETAAHTASNSRITIMFVAFTGPPKIMRLHGHARVIRRDAAPEDLGAHFASFGFKGARSVVVVDVDRFSDSCGFSIPQMDYAEERTVLKDKIGKMTEEDIAGFILKWNSFSIDRLPSIGHRALGAPAPAVAARWEGGYWFGRTDLTAWERVCSLVQRPKSHEGGCRRDLSMMCVGALAAALLIRCCAPARLAH